MQTISRLLQIKGVLVDELVEQTMFFEDFKNDNIKIWINLEETKVVFEFYNLNSDQMLRIEDFAVKAIKAEIVKDMFIELTNKTFERKTINIREFYATQYYINSYKQGHHDVIIKGTVV